MIKFCKIECSELGLKSNFYSAKPDWTRGLAIHHQIFSSECLEAAKAHLRWACKPRGPAVAIRVQARGLTGSSQMRYMWLIGIETPNAGVGHTHERRVHVAQGI